MDCKSHPEKPAAYYCLACKNYFCGSCVSVRKVTQDFTAYVCLTCGGKCDSLAGIEKEAKKKELKFPFLPKKESNDKKESAGPVEKLPKKPFFQKAAGGPSAKKEPRPLNEKFWVNLPGVLFFPLKGLGALHLFFNAGILFALTEHLKTGWVFNFLLWAAYLTYAGIFLFKIVEDSTVGSRSLEQVNLVYWTKVSMPLVYLIIVSISCLGPAQLYFIFQKKLDALYLVLLMAGIFILPMMVVRIALFRTLGSLNPLKASAAIKNHFLPYAAMILILLALEFLKYYLNFDVLTDYRNTQFLAYLVFVYIVFVMMRLIGVFARCYKQKIY